MRSFLATILLMLSLPLAAQAADAPPAPSNETITLAGGCFWCMEAVFDELKGVTKVESGYAGGHVPNPTYEQVSSGETGHAESVQITFDPQAVSLDKTLKFIFTIPDP